MGDPSEIERHAIKLLHHRANAIPNPVLPEGDRLNDLSLAYPIQDAADAILRDTRGYKAIGYKLAGTNPVSRAHLKIDGPFFGRLYDQMTSVSPATVIDVGFFAFTSLKLPLKSVAIRTWLRLPLMQPK